MPSRKRKRSNSPDPDAAKKYRYDLARNLSQLSLFEQERTTTPALQSTPLPWPVEPAADAPMDADIDIPATDTVCPIAEEPADVRATIPEIRMHNTSSYEPEKDRIVVTDLDSSEDEADTPPHTSTGNNTQFSVSPAFLSRIKASKFATPLMKPLPRQTDSDPSRALVLFTPSPWAAKDSRELEGIYRARDMEKENNDLIVTEVANADADAMEIE